MTDSLVPMSQSHDLATTLHLRSGFADSVLDYPRSLPAPLADAYRHVQYFHEMMNPGHPMGIPSRVAIVQAFLSHDYVATLKAALDQPPLTEDEISEMAKFI